MERREGKGKGEGGGAEVAETVALTEHKEDVFYLDLLGKLEMEWESELGMLASQFVLTLLPVWIHWIPTASSHAHAYRLH